MMSSLFGRKSRLKHFEPSGNVLYDTVNQYCACLGLACVSYAEVTATYGQSFTVDDIARMSHITVRRVVLSERWYRKRTQPFVGFYGEDFHPVLCVPTGLTRKMLYDLSDNSSRVIDAEIAAGFDSDIYQFYRSLPEEAVTVRQVLRFGLAAVSASDIALILVMTLLSTLVGLLLPILNEQLFDKLIPMGSFPAILELGTVVFACSIGNMFFMLAKNLSSFRAVTGAQYSISSAMFIRLFHLPQSFIERFGNSDLVSRAMGFQDCLQELGSSFLTAVLGALFSFVYLIRMFTQSKPLTWRGIIMVGILVLVLFVCNHFRVRYERLSLDASYRARSILYSFVSGIMKVRISGMEDRALYEYQKENTKYIGNELASSNWQIFSNVFSGMMTIVFSIVFYYTVVTKDIDLSLGQFASFSSAFGMFSAAFMQLTNFLMEIPQVRPVFERAKPIFDTPVESYAGTSSIGHFTGNIEINNLEFRYSEDEQNVLDGISLSVRAGEYVGIVGPSGCGKSTLMKLLLGFETPTRGNIYYDDKDVTTLDKRELRRQMGVVLQDGSLIIGTIFENIALAAPNLTTDEAKKLLVEAGMGADIERMPMGIFTAVSEFGGSLSGGQQQRILIARALANNPSVLLFDEATSALDNTAQDTLCKTLEKRNITRIVVAHRLSTVQQCDRIYVLDDGKIVESGSYRELIDKKGFLYNMSKDQLLD